MKRTLVEFAVAAVVLVGVTVMQAAAGTGTFIKYNQPIGHLIQPDNMMSWGEDIPSDVDWNLIMQTPTAPPNWVIADDFRDPYDLPVITVKWWGSYVGPTHELTATGVVDRFGPGSEDGYLISFFTDVPVGPENEFSHPGRLLGSYVLPYEKVRVNPTPYIGWHDPGTDPNDPRLRIWEYEADLMDAHFAHGQPDGPAQPNGFYEKAGEVYWISIVAEVGHKPVLIIDDAGEVRWESLDTNKFANDHYWGWHTSPRPFNDVATMSHLAMPGNEWEYLPDWIRIDPRHGLFDMAFQLKTIPEPSSLMLGVLTLAAGILTVRRGRP